MRERELASQEEWAFYLCISIIIISDDAMGLTSGQEAISD